MSFTFKDSKSAGAETASAAAGEAEAESGVHIDQRGAGTESFRLCSTVVTTRPSVSSHSVWIFRRQVFHPEASSSEAAKPQPQVKTGVLEAVCSTKAIPY